MHQLPSETRAEFSARCAANPPAAHFPDVFDAHHAALQWLALPPERSKELAAELRQFTAAAAAVRPRVRFDGEPADWDVVCVRWHGSPP